MFDARHLFKVIHVHALSTLTGVMQFIPLMNRANELTVKHAMSDATAVHGVSVADRSFPNQALAIRLGVREIRFLDREKFVRHEPLYTHNMVSH